MITTAGASRWHALTCPPQREGALEAFLARQEVYSFHPVRTREKLDRGKRVVIESRYIPGYVFARFPGPVVWHRLMQCNLVTGAIRMSNGALAILDPSDLRGLMAMAARGDAEDERRRAALRIAPGDTVRLASGAFEGQTVEVWHVGNGRARFSIRMFGADLPCEAPLSAMVKVAE